MADVLTVFRGLIRADPGSTLTLTGCQGDTPGATGVVIDTDKVLTDGKPLSVRMAGAEVASVNQDGALSVLSFLLAGRKIASLAAAPVAGTWAVGDLAFNSAPAAGGVIGWVCTADGTPGTWKEFGSISL